MSRGGRDGAFECPAETLYRRTVSVAMVPDAAGNPQRIWSLSVYVERIDQGCTPATRFETIGCVAADLYLTD